jgi:hypothetical protein
LPEDIISYADAFALDNFAPTATQLQSFGGTVVSGPIMDGGTHSALQNQPHDIIHVVVGGHPLLGSCAAVRGSGHEAAVPRSFGCTIAASTGCESAGWVRAAGRQPQALRLDQARRHDPRQDHPRKTNVGVSALL